MRVKSQLLLLLETNRGRYLSGQEIANALGVSRTSIWKAVQSLQAEGHEILATPSLGYLLLSQSDALSLEIAGKQIENAEFAKRLQLFSTVDSTHRIATQLALSGAPHGTTIVANTQSAGRGRYQDRVFYSPANAGVYFSIVLRNHTVLQSAQQITVAVALSVCEIVEQLTGKQLQIKWVNDLFWQGKKVGGILTQAMITSEINTAAWVVVGIGLNVHYSTFDDILAPLVTSLFAKDEPKIPLRNRLVAAFINCFADSTEWLTRADLFDGYHNRLMLVGKSVKVLSHQNSYLATVVGLDEQFRLLVQPNDGGIAALHSGEVSLQL